MAVGAGQGKCVGVGGAREGAGAGSEGVILDAGGGVGEAEGEAQVVARPAIENAVASETVTRAVEGESADRVGVGGHASKGQRHVGRAGDGPGLLALHIAGGRSVVAVVEYQGLDASGKGFLQHALGQSGGSEQAVGEGGRRAVVDPARQAATVVSAVGTGERAIEEAARNEGGAMADSNDTTTGGVAAIVGGDAHAGAAILDDHIVVAGGDDTAGIAHRGGDGARDMQVPDGRIIDIAEGADVVGGGVVGDSDRMAIAVEGAAKHMGRTAQHSGDADVGSQPDMLSAEGDTIVYQGCQHVPIRRRGNQVGAARRALAGPQRHLGNYLVVRNLPARAEGGEEFRIAHAAHGGPLGRAEGLPVVAARAGDIAGIVVAPTREGGGIRGVDRHLGGPEEAMGEGGRGGAEVGIGPADEATAMRGGGANQLAVEEAVDAVDMAVVNHAHEAAVGAVAIHRAVDLDARPAVEEGGVAVGVADDSGVTVLGIDGAGNTQEPEGCPLDITERRTVRVAETAPRGAFVEGQRVAVTVEIAAETQLVGAHHLADGDVIGHLQEHAVVRLAQGGDVEGHIVPVRGGGNQVGRICRAVARQRLERRDGDHFPTGNLPRPAQGRLQLAVRVAAGVGGVGVAVVAQGLDIVAVGARGLAGIAAEGVGAAGAEVPRGVGRVKHTVDHDGVDGTVSPADETAPVGRAAAGERAVEEAVDDIDRACVVQADEAAMRAVAAPRTVDGDARAAADDHAAAVDISHDTRELVRGVDGAGHMQALEGGATNPAKGGRTGLVSVDVDSQRVSCAIEGTAETVGTGARHGADADVGGQLHKLAVVTRAARDAGGKSVPVGRTGNNIRIRSRARTRQALRLHRRPESRQQQRQEHHNTIFNLLHKCI